MKQRDAILGCECVSEESEYRLEMKDFRGRRGRRREGAERGEKRRKGEGGRREDRRGGGGEEEEEREEVEREGEVRVCACQEETEWNMNTPPPETTRPCRFS